METQRAWHEADGEGAKMSVLVVEPQEAGTYPGLVVYHGAPGVEAELPQLEHLASEGFVCAAPDMYYRWVRRPAGEEARAHVSKLWDFGVAQNFRIVINLLKGLPNVAEERIGCVGYCLGGDNSYLTACFNSDIRAAVVCYGGRVATPSPGRMPPLDFAERVQCPMLNLSGDHDTRPSPDDIRQIDETMKRLGKQYEYHIYPGAAHAFFSEGSQSYHAPSAEAAWPVKLEELEGPPDRTAPHRR